MLETMHIAGDWVVISIQAAPVLQFLHWGRHVLPSATAPPQFDVPELGVPLNPPEQELTATSISCEQAASLNAVT
jgi:hypothetical protein